MAWDRNGPHTVETERPGADVHAVADAERLGIDPEITDRPAHAWEVDEAESWEPVVPDSWDPPTADDEGGSDDEATWSDAARSEREWATAGPDVGEATSATSHAPQTVRPPGLDAGQAEHPADGPVRPAEPSPRPDNGAQGPQPPLTRMALGLASLAAQRMRGGVPAGDGMVIGFGVLRHTATGLMALGERVIGPASRVASGAVKGAATLPLVGAPIRIGLRSQRWLATSAAQARITLARFAAGDQEPAREAPDAPGPGPAQASTVDGYRPAERQ